MKLAIGCAFLVVCTALPLTARAQVPDSLPTMPALPVIIDGPPQFLPGPPPSSPALVPLLPPSPYPDSFYPRPESGPPWLNQPSDRSTFDSAPAPSWSPPPVAYLPESVQVRPRPTFGQILYAFFHPFRRTTESPAPEPAVDASSPVEIAAAAIKADEMGAERRRSAIRYLASVDCAFNPEAESALLTALRCDRHESVRHEAALALSNRWCWTTRTLDALNQAMTGGAADGHPSERSDRVRLAAWQALSSYAEALHPQPRQPLAQMSVSAIRRTSYEVSPSLTRRVGAAESPAAPSGGNRYGPGNAKAAPPQVVDVSSLPPLRPIGQVPEVEPDQPAYEPTPLQAPVTPRR